jgi:AraC-like DNA-binding protein
MIKVKLLNLLVLLLRHYGYVKTDEINEHVQELKIINQVTDYIDHNFENEIKLKELANIAHMHPTYFSSFFKKYNGLSPVDYIIRKRISHSMDYLRATDKTVIEIAGLCGFNNSSNYNKMFKKISNMTPSEFRKVDDFRMNL